MMNLEKLYQALYSNKGENIEFFESKGFSRNTLKKFNLFQLTKDIDIDEIRDVFSQEGEAFFNIYQYVIPGFDVNGGLDYIMIRRRADYIKTPNCSFHKHIYIGEIDRGLGKIFNSYHLMDDEKVLFIVETWTDALSLEELGYPAIAMNRVANCHTVLEPLVKKYKENIEKKKIIIMCDSDEIGVTANCDIKTMFFNNGIPCVVMNKYPQGIKDANEWLLYDRNGFREAIAAFLEGIK